MAGIMNVRADRSIQWPEKQEIGDLKLNFIRLAPKAKNISLSGLISDGRRTDWDKDGETDGT